MADTRPHQAPKPSQTAQSKAKAKSKIRAPWPDDAARQQMSQAHAQEDMGKHGKNPDWQKQW